MRPAGLPTTLVIAVFVLAVVTTIAHATEAPDDSDRGREVFAANCARCHGPDARGMMGPSLHGVVERLGREGVEVTIRNGRRTSPPMPAFEGQLSAMEIDALIAYLSTLPPEDGDGGRGGGMMDGMMDGPMGAWMWLIPVLAATALVALVGVLLLALRSRRPPSSNPESEG